jgi:perosamine synthetase
MKCLCLHGISRDAWNRYTANGSWYYEVNECGFKYNLSDLQSAIGIHQLQKQESFIKIRQRYAAIYSAILGNMDEVELPVEASPRSRHAWHLYSIKLNLGSLRIDRAAFIQMLKEHRIGASVHFIPIQMHPFFRQFATLRQNQCPAALAMYPRLISLPLYPAMTEGEVEYVGRTVRSLLEQHSMSQALVARPAGSEYRQASLAS